MKIDKKYWDIWDNLSFKTISYNKNFNFVNTNDNIITEIAGTVSLLRTKEILPPIILGEYGISIWNIKFGKTWGIDLDKLLSDNKIENTYSELIKVIKNNDINIYEYDKIVLIPQFLLRADFRKHFITEEFIEMLYRNYHDDKVLILALVKPIQNNEIDWSFFQNEKVVEVYHEFDDVDLIDAGIYYSLNDLAKKKDTEINEYKLFSVAAKCGFTRIGESYLFKYMPDKTIKRIKDKIIYNDNLNG